MATPLKLDIKVDSKGAVTKVKQLDKAIDKAGKGAMTAEKKFKGLGGGLGKLKSLIGPLIGAAGFAALAIGVGKLGKAMISTSATFESLEVRLEVFYGSAEAARAKLEELTTFASETPFQLQGIVEAQLNLKTFGVEADNVLQIVGDAAASVGKELDEVAMWVGRLYAGDIGESFSRLREMGLVTKELLEMEGVKFKGRQIVTGAKETFAAMMVAMEKRFKGGMEKLSKTWFGMVSTLIDRWKDIMVTVGEPIFEKAKEGLEKILELFDDLEKHKAFEKLESGISDTIEVIGGITTAITVLGKTVRAFHPELWLVEKILRNWGSTIGKDIERLKGFFKWVGLIKEEVKEVYEGIGPFEFIGPRELKNVNDVKKAYEGLPSIFADIRKELEIVEFKPFDVDAINAAGVEVREQMSSMYQWQYEHEEISAENYLAFLETRLSDYRVYSAEWKAIKREMAGVEKEVDEENKEAAKSGWDEVKVAAQQYVSSVTSSLASIGVESLWDINNIGKAWRKWGEDVLKDLAKIIVKLIIVKSLAAVFGGGPLGFLFAHEGGEVKHSGGPIKGYQYGGTVDDVLIRAQRGEFMVQRSSVNAETRTLLEAINKTGKVPRTGGTVSIVINTKTLDDRTLRKDILPRIQREAERIIS